MVGAFLYCSCQLVTSPGGTNYAMPILDNHFHICAISCGLRLPIPVCQGICTLFIYDEPLLLQVSLMTRPFPLPLQSCI